MDLERRYASFLVRMWQEPGDEDHAAGWRGSVEHVQTGEKRFFNNLESLLAYLRAVAEPEHIVAGGKLQGAELRRRLIR